MKTDEYLRQIARITLCWIFVGAPLCVAQTGTFQQVPGSLSQISVGADGAVWGLDSSQNIFTWDSGAGQFVQIPGALAQIAVGNANAVWGLNAAGYIYHWNSSTQNWTSVPGNLMQIAVGGDGDVWGFNNDNQVWHYIQDTQTWELIGGVPAAFPIVTQIAVGNDGSVYLVNNFSPAYYSLFQYTPGAQQFEAFAGVYTQDNPSGFGLQPTLSVGADGDLWSTGQGQVFHYNPMTTVWDELSSLYNLSFTQVTAGSGANVWALTNDNQIWQWDAQNASWTSIPGSLIQIASGADGSVWGINMFHQVYRYLGPTQPYQALIPVSGSFQQISTGFDGTTWAVDANDLVYAFDRTTQRFQNVPGALAQVSVSSSNAVWGVNPSGQIWAWSSPNGAGYAYVTAGWTYIPGELNQIAVTENATSFDFAHGDANSAVFGINSAGQTYVYGNNGWVNIPGALMQLSAAADGTAWGINAGQQIYRYDDTSNSWTQIPGALVQISVGSAANVWGVNANQQVYRFDATIPGWDQIPGALLTQVAVAFDGTVWGVNAEGSLYQWNSGTQSFNFIANGVTNVAVGSDSAVFAWNTNTGATYWYF